MENLKKEMTLIGLIPNRNDEKFGFQITYVRANDRLCQN
jgi:hypothetical protein